MRKLLNKFSKLHEEKIKTSFFNEKRRVLSDEIIKKGNFNDKDVENAKKYIKNSRWSIPDYNENLPKNEILAIAYSFYILNKMWD